MKVELICCDRKIEIGLSDFTELKQTFMNSINPALGNHYKKLDLICSLPEPMKHIALERHLNKALDLCDDDYDQLKCMPFFYDLASSGSSPSNISKMLYNCIQYKEVSKPIGSWGDTIVSYGRLKRFLLYSAQSGHEVSWSIVYEREPCDDSALGVEFSLNNV